MGDVLVEQLDVVVLIVVFEIFHREATLSLEEAHHLNHVGFPGLMYYFSTT